MITGKVLQCFKTLTCVLIGIMLLTFVTLLFSRNIQKCPELKISLPNPLDDVLFDEIPRPDEKYLEFHNLSSVPLQIIGLECVKTRTTPSYDICIYPVNVDIYVSQSLRTGGMWEPDISMMILELLNSNPSSVFLDVGANIGYFSLLAAAAGHMVVSVEPNIESVKRIHTSVQRNNITSNMIMLRNAAADKRTFATLLLNNINQGDVQIQNMKECQGLCPPTVKTIIINDLAHLIHNLTWMSTNENDPGNSLYDRLTKFRMKHFPNKLNRNMSKTFKNPPANVIIKIDVQGFEHKAFHKPHIFFDVNRVTHIFMEWEEMKKYGQFNVESKIPYNATHPEMEDPLKQDADKVNAMIRFFIERGITPYSSTRPTLGQALDPNNWHLWPQDIVWCHYSHTKLALRESLISQWTKELEWPTSSLKRM